jgi:2-polyprenyl-3-methyl-5-hydroxy-6-metoxy-1,4-benzoquinol methylase
MTNHKQYEKINQLLKSYHKSQYSNIDSKKTLSYMKKRYINPVKYHLHDLNNLSVFDCGCGHGWLGFSYILNGASKAILCDVDRNRLNLSKKIAKILKIYNKCEFICKPMEMLDASKYSVDIFTCVETLEHVGESNIDSCIRFICRVTNKLIIITTPNKLFPIVMHDSMVPFAHWFPKNIRKEYVKMFGRIDNDLNDFVSPCQLNTLKIKFAPSSKVLTFPTFDDWEKSYPFESPYNVGNRFKHKAPWFLKYYYKLSQFIFGYNSYMISPNLCSLWIKKTK